MSDMRMENEVLKMGETMAMARLQDATIARLKELIKQSVESELPRVQEIQAIYKIHRLELAIESIKEQFPEAYFMLKNALK